MKAKLAALTGLLFAVHSTATAVVVLSNFDNTPETQININANARAVQFTTGTAVEGGWTLTGVTVKLNNNSGDPASLTPYIYTSSSGNPGTSLGSLGSLDPTGAGDYSFSTAGIGLANDTSYFLVLIAGGGDASNYYTWRRSSSTSETSSFGWTVGNNLLYSADLSNWSTFASPPLFEIDAVPVPEPSAYTAIGSLGALGVAFWNRRRKVKAN